MVFKNTVKPGDNITVPEITLFSGSILDTASNPLNTDNLSNMSFLLLQTWMVLNLRKLSQLKMELQHTKVRDCFMEE